MEINNLQPEQLLSDSTNKNLVGKYSENSHKKIKCVCDFKNAEDCLGIVSREYRDFLKTYKNNNNKYICFRCSRATKYQSEKNPNKKFHYNIDFNNYNSDSNVAYLLGWIASDGTVSHKTGSISLKIKKDDEEILNYFIKTFKLNSLIKYDKNVKFASLHIHNKSSAQIIRDILSLPSSDTCKKSDIIKCPKFTDIECFRRFVQGVFEGDGHVRNINKRKYLDCCIVSNSPIFLEELKTQLNIRGEIYRNSLTWNALNAIKFLNFIYKNKQFALSRKYDMYKQWELRYRIYD